MKKFVLKLIQFILLLTLIFYVLDLIVTTGLRKSRSETYNTVNKIMDGKMDADVIIQGSSKAYVQVSPEILDSILHKNTYNLGMDGNEFLPQLLQYQLFKKYNDKPELIIQIVGNDFLQKKKELFGFMRFAPIIQEEGVKEITKQYDGFTFLDYNLPFIRYSGYFGLIVDGTLSNFGIHVREDSNYKGYYERDISWDNSFDKFKAANPKGITIDLNETLKKEFVGYIQNTKMENIPLILVYPPTYSPAQDLILNRNEILGFYEDLAKKYNIPFLDYASHPMSNDNFYFYNSQHLNKTGAEKFTKILAEEIKELNVLKNP